MTSTRVPPNVIVQSTQEGELAPTSPTVARWELSLRLKKRRLELGLPVKEITDELGFTRNYWSQVENERAVLADDKFAALLQLFRIDDQERHELSELREATRARGWWAEFAGVEEETQRLLGLESGATEIRCFGNLSIPGLVQTEDYTRAMLEPDPMFSDIQISQTVEIRKRRQARLTESSPVRFTAMVSEAALHQQVGGKGVHRAQLEYLKWIVDGGIDSVDIEVIPFTASPGPLLGSSTLVFMDFASPHLPTVVWEESVRAIGSIDDPAQSDRLTRCYNYGLRECLNPEATKKLLVSLLNEGQAAR